VNQHIQFAPLPMFGRLEVCETNDLGLGLDFESWRELYGARVSGLAVDTRTHGNGPVHRAAANKANNTHNLFFLQNHERIFS
jgi:hypothetical protein